MRLLFQIICCLALTAFGTAQPPAKVSIEGHRGARGHLPENTIPSFKKALDLGADTIELDVVVSRDRKVVVSHEPWFAASISLDPAGRRIERSKEKEHNIFLMAYSEIRKYDVGSLGNAAFPDQKPIKAHKPLLSEVFKALDRYARSKGLPPVRYNIEIKAGPENDAKFQPPPDEFAALVLRRIRKAGITSRAKVQSFDVRPLQEMKRLAPSIRIALLVGGKDGIEKSIERLGFRPDTYSPHYSLVDEATVKYCRANGIKLVPWTVNEIADLEKLRAFQPDGIITDYPERALRVFH